MGADCLFRIFKSFFNRRDFLLVSNLCNLLPYKAIGSVLFFKNMVNPLSSFIANEFTFIKRDFLNKVIQLKPFTRKEKVLQV